MRVLNTSAGKIGIGLLAFLVCLPIIYAQRPQQSHQGASSQQGKPEVRKEPSHAPVEHRPVVVDRVNHGSIRHVDTHKVERPVEVYREVESRQHVIAHRDVEVDIDRSRSWHGFVYGRRVGALRAGFLRVLVNAVPYFYDSGIYYQQAGDGYQEVYPPVGAGIAALPDGAIEIDAGNMAYYYAAGAFYVRQDGGFVVAPTPMGVMVPELPPGAVQVSVSGGVAYQFNAIYYRPMFVNGVTQYMTFTP